MGISAWVDGKWRSCREERWHLQRAESFLALACILRLRKQSQISMDFYVGNEEKEREIPQTRMCKIRMAFGSPMQNIWRKQEHLWNFKRKKFHLIDLPGWLFSIAWAADSCKCHHPNAKRSWTLILKVSCVLINFASGYIFWKVDFFFWFFFFLQLVEANRLL